MDAHMFRTRISKKNARERPLRCETPGQLKSSLVPCAMKWNLSSKRTKGYQRKSLKQTPKINFSQVFAGQAVGIKEVHDDIWLVSFMDYDLGYFDLETRVLEPLENPFGPKVLPMS
jgi:hypothetical protein